MLKCKRKSNGSFESEYELEYNKFNLIINEQLYRLKENRERKKEKKMKQTKV